MHLHYMWTGESGNMPEVPAAWMNIRVLNKVWNQHMLLMDFWKWRQAAWSCMNRKWSNGCYHIITRSNAARVMQSFVSCVILTHLTKVVIGVDLPRTMFVVCLWDSRKYEELVNRLEWNLVECKATSQGMRQRCSKIQKLYRHFCTFFSIFIEYYI